MLVKKERADYIKQGGYTYEDYLKLPEEPGCRYEIPEGFLVKEPSPSKHHQRVSATLFRQLADFFDGFDPEGELFFAPLVSAFRSGISKTKGRHKHKKRNLKL